MKHGDWTRDEELLTFQLYVEIRDHGRDDKAPIKALAKLLDRDPDAVRSAVFAPAKHDPAWTRTRPSHGLKPTARLLWDEYSADLPRLRAETKAIEASLKAAAKPSGDDGA